MSHLRKIRDTSDDDPLQGVANLFDLGIVFALGFLLALMSFLGMNNVFDQSRMTKVKDPNGPQMEIIHDDGESLEHYRVSEQSVGGEGVRLGTAFRLKNGEVVYVPEDSLNSTANESSR
ncbi:DUF2149 domain-containing protein [Calycomorphotria hydatis]|uniref:DUF2149 domain-containing protein n=1 Tax=Calycomorphotria hydatis TaxID=2528027 RepID=A0A517TD71_9PLAN|nr:DUF2149 domain-containing protein [Calycomorphotria hydatis]QDT66323.1 hypothetical protein V22_35890 [Calycomorphotria hydatis]